MKVTVTVTVKPGSKKGPLIQPGLTGELLVYVREPALEGKANKAVREQLAIYYDIPKIRVQIISGLSSKHKIFQVELDEIKSSPSDERGL